jgi:hypothetical protein
MALTDKLTAIADGFRASRGTEDKYTLDQMAVLAAEPTGGGGLPEEALTISGNCSFRFKDGGWDWFLRDYGNQITTKDITSAQEMFYSSKQPVIPFDLNFTTAHNTTHNITSMFSNSSIESAPKLIGCNPVQANNLFYSCYYLREVSEESVANVNWSYMSTITSGYGGSRSSTFENCYSLRRAPISFLNGGNPVSNYSYCIYKSAFKNCYALDEVVGMPFPHSNATWTSDVLSSTVDGCYRLKNFTFAVQPNGQPYTANWKNQTLMLTYVGYENPYANYPTDLYVGASALFRYNAGLSADKYVYDDATYQALKDDPDWFTNLPAYSRYNHDSAVATINSLPDTSAYLATAGGTNKIQFRGIAGEKTDGGAINTLTDEEIAVATAKGWTVEIV